MKYKIIVRPPKAKKMEGHVEVAVTQGDAVHSFEQFPVKPGSFEFEVPGDVPWQYNNPIAGSPVFQVMIVYRNKDGTKEEIIFPVPDEVV